MRKSLITKSKQEIESYIRNNIAKQAEKYIFCKISKYNKKQFEIHT